MCFLLCFHFNRLWTIGKEKNLKFSPILSVLGLKIVLLEVLLKYLILLTIQNVLKALYWTLMSQAGVAGKLDQKLDLSLHLWLHSANCTPELQFTSASQMYTIKKSRDIKPSTMKTAWYNITLTYQYGVSKGLKQHQLSPPTLPAEGNPGLKLCSVKSTQYVSESTRCCLLYMRCLGVSLLLHNGPRWQESGVQVL